MSTITIEKDGNVAVLRINRPEALNALNSQVLNDLADTIDLVEQDDEIFVAVLAGAGRAFVAGADITAMSTYNATEGKQLSDRGNAVFLKLENMTKPIIAAVHGYALGGGCELAMACDICLASNNAKFGLPEVGIGVMPGFGGTQRLPRIVGMARAMELILTARNFSAEYAKQYGLVSEVYPDEELMDKALEMAHLIAAQPQVAVRQAKRSARRGIQMDLYTGLSYEAEAFALCFSTEDQKDAMAAFLQKRKLDKFKNR